MNESMIGSTSRKKGKRKAQTEPSLEKELKHIKKHEKPFKIGSVQPDLDQTLSNFRQHDYQHFFKALGQVSQ